MTQTGPASELPVYRNAIDWDAFFREFPLPDVFARTVYLWQPERIRELQNSRFLKIMERGWSNPFYRRRWRAAGLEPGDIRSLDDIANLPPYTSDDVKASTESQPPYGEFHGVNPAIFATTPLKLQTSGGTTGVPRPTLFDPLAWELQALSGARGLYIQGARPGDVMQIPMTCSLANAPWLAYKACHEYLGILPLTTGSGVVTSSRQQLDIAFRYGTNLWQSFPEYLIRLAQTCREELRRDVRELKTKFIRTYLGPDVDGALRRDIEAQWGCTVYDGYGTNEIALAGFECRERSGLHFMEDLVFMEVIDVETGKPVAPGERGNLVATALGRTLPLIIRYNVRDLGRIIGVERCGCGSHFRRMDHFLGRSDAMVKLRGVNVYPMACLPAIKSDARTTGEWVCVVERVQVTGVPRDEMHVYVEVRRDASTREGLKEKLEQRLRDDLGVAMEVKLTDEGSLQEMTNTGGREGKARRLIDRRPSYKAGNS
jgi:phenylacetate-CoA ligase